MHSCCQDDTEGLQLGYFVQLLRQTLQDNSCCLRHVGGMDGVVVRVWEVLDFDARNEPLHRGPVQFPPLLRQEFEGNVGQSGCACDRPVMDTVCAMRLAETHQQVVELQQRNGRGDQRAAMSGLCQLERREVPGE